MSVEASNLGPKFKKRRRESAASKLAEAKSTTFKDVKQDQKIKKIEGILKGLRPELKYKDKEHNAVVDYNGTIFNVSETISQGDADTARNGDQIYTKGFRVFGHAGSTDATQSVVRAIVILDKHGTITSVAEVLKTVGSLAAVDSHYVFDAQGRRTEFIVLADKRITVGGNTTSRSNALFDMNYKFKYAPKSDYEAGTTTNLKNSLLYVLISDRAPTSTVQVVMNFRMFFTDP